MAYRDQKYSLYKGLEKAYTTLYQVAGRSKRECLERCTEEPKCDTVKVNHATGPGKKKCSLMTLDGSGSVMATDIWEKN